MAEIHGTKDSLSQTGPEEKMEQMHHREYLAQGDNIINVDTKKKEDALRRKLDLYVAPVMMILMLISYLDRGNIGFAATQGMTKDIGLKGSELNVGSHKAILESRSNNTITDCRLSVLHLLHSRRGKSI